MHEMLGTVADCVASCVGDAVAAAEATIAANKLAKAEAQQAKEAAKEAERERRLAEGLEEEEEEEEEEDEAKPAVELDADGNPIPPPIIPVESLQTPEFMQAFTAMVREAANGVLDAFEATMAAKGAAVAAEIDRKVALAEAQHFSWSVFDQRRRRAKLLVGALEVRYTHTITPVSSPPCHGRTKFTTALWMRTVSLGDVIHDQGHTNNTVGPWSVLVQLRHQKRASDRMLPGAPHSSHYGRVATHLPSTTALRSLALRWTAPLRSDVCGWMDGRNGYR
jgi:hypothetical protein